MSDGATTDGSTDGSTLVLAVDCSTTAAKAVVLDGDGRVLASAAQRLDLSTPGPGRHEQDARQWWQATRTAIRTAMGALTSGGVPADRLVAMSLTHQRESFVCLDADDVPLRPAILWLDSRAAEQIATLGSDRVREVSGKPPDVTPSLYKLAWVAQHEPEVMSGAVRIAEVHGYLARRLTGRWATSVASADSLGLLDLAAGDWSAELLDLAGVRRDQLPDLVAPGDLLAVVAPDVCRDLGLPQGLPLIAGIGDGQAAGLGAGLTAGEPEDAEGAIAYVNLGTSMVMGVPSTRYLTDAAFRTLAGAPQGTFVLETVLNAAAYLADWFRRELAGSSTDGAPDPALEAAAAALPPGAEGLLTLPYWNCAQTPYWDTAARGAMVGWHGGHTRAHAYRSLLEGVAFELRLHLDGLETVSGQRITQLRVMGGGSRSPLWTQVVADVTGRTVHLCGDNDEISARGAAVLAWAGAATGTGTETGTETGTGTGTSLGERIAAASTSMAAAALAGGARRLPRVDEGAAYDALFPVYRMLYPALRPAFAALQTITDRAAQAGSAHAAPRD